MLTAIASDFVVPRLFVDCDDTLILYSDKRQSMHPYGVFYGQEYVPNTRLIAQMNEFVSKYPDALVVIWSGGGYRYAEEVAKLLYLEHLDASYLTKDVDTFSLVRKCDIVVDDLNLESLPCYTYKPDEWRCP